MSSFLLFVAMSVSLSWAQKTGDLELRYFVNESYTKVHIKKTDRFRVNEECAKKASACKALKVAKGKPMKMAKTEAPFRGDVGANYCWDVGAKNRILKDEKNNQYDYCVFEDGSMVDAWDLYSAHYPPPVIK